MWYPQYLSVLGIHQDAVLSRIVFKLRIAVIAIRDKTVNPEWIDGKGDFFRTMFHGTQL